MNFIVINNACLWDILCQTCELMFRLVSRVGKGLGLLLRWKWFLYHLQASFVLCRVFVKSRSGNSVSENVLGSCAEEGVSAVRHIGIQHEGFLTPEIVEAKINCDDFTKELDDPIVTRHISVASFEFPSGIPPDLPNDLVTWFEHILLSWKLYYCPFLFHFIGPFICATKHGFCKYFFFSY